MCTCCVGVEEFSSPIRKWSEERDNFFFVSVFKFKREG